MEVFFPGPVDPSAGLQDRLRLVTIQITLSFVLLRYIRDRTLEFIQPLQSINERTGGRQKPGAGPFVTNGTPDQPACPNRRFT
ncbi:hypothetical protein E2A64_16370 [Pseudohoeflea suaedae]|uniref:Syntaxin-5 N-terminal Sly1p-binding domain-containing protein n=1 Tax=Pseudohoeflea suaedae TaxID=877384 RepID=A0A4V3A6U7_9HYPH|nr:hypothetical protein E2A64_16370 [Pseudohoeflea suaedae]